MDKQSRCTLPGRSLWAAEGGKAISLGQSGGCQARRPP